MRLAIPKETADGERLVRMGRQLVPPRRRPDADRFARVIYDIVGRYIAGTLFMAALAGVVILVASLSLGVPLAPLLAVWVAICNPMPQVGGFLGAVPFVALGLTQSAVTGVICLVVFLIYQQTENHILQPLIIDPSVKGADYTVSTILAEAFPQEVQALYKQYADSYASGQNFVNLTLVSDLAK